MGRYFLEKLWFLIGMQRQSYVGVCLKYVKVFVEIGIDYYVYWVVEERKGSGQGIYMVEDFFCGFYYEEMYVI